MTIIWIALWAGISIFILGVFVWTTKALQIQKATWKRFAAARGLTYTPGRFLEAARVSGVLNGFDLVLTSEERDNGDFRGRKFVTLLQLSKIGAFPGAAGVGSADYKIFLQNLRPKDEMPDLASALGGDDIAAAFSDDAALNRSFFTPERVRILDGLIKQPRVSILFLFDSDQGCVRLETMDPLLKKGQVDKLLDRIIPMIGPLWP